MSDYASQERWLPVVGYEDLYEVSDLGHVRSLDRVVELVDKGTLCWHKYAGKVLSPSITQGRLPSRAALP